MEKVKKSLETVFKNPFYAIIGVALSLNLLLIYYLIFSQTTTLPLFFSTTNPVYAWLSILLTLATALAFGVALTLILYRWKEMPSIKGANKGKNIVGTIIGAFSMGCPTCGAFLLPLIGVAGLSAFPFQGLELKVGALLLFGLSIYESASCVADKKCEVKEGLLKTEKGTVTLNLSKSVFMNYLAPLVIVALMIVLPFLPVGYKLNVSAKNGAVGVRPSPSVSNNGQTDNQALLDQINPPSGYETKAVYGNIGPQLVTSGAIDLEKLKKIYQDAGQPLTQEQMDILTKGSNEKVKITPQNSYFLLNFFWAFGLANKNKVLDEGPMSKYSNGQIENFASTGGWTVGAKSAGQLFSKYEIVKLTSDQQKALEDFAYNSYRPCCSNPTGFPDCNHGMAALGLGELMASQGASADDMFTALKYFNAFWFQQTYFDIANYFKAKDGKIWDQVDARMVDGKDYSTPQGAQMVHQWLVSNNLVKEPPSSGGGGCGV